MFTDEERAKLEQVRRDYIDDRYLDLQEERKADNRLKFARYLAEQGIINEGLDGQS